jgi:hypothetical protein
MGTGMGMGRGRCISWSSGAVKLDGYGWFREKNVGSICEDREAGCHGVLNMDDVLNIDGVLNTASSRASSLAAWNL